METSAWAQYAYTSRLASLQAMLVSPSTPSWGHPFNPDTPARSAFTRTSAAIPWRDPSPPTLHHRPAAYFNEIPKQHVRREECTSMGNSSEEEPKLREKKNRKEEEERERQHHVELLLESYRRKKIQDPVNTHQGDDDVDEGATDDEEEEEDEEEETGQQRRDENPEQERVPLTATARLPKLTVNDASRSPARVPSPCKRISISALLNPDCNDEPSVYTRIPPQQSPTLCRPALPTKMAIHNLIADDESEPTTQQALLSPQTSCPSPPSSAMQSPRRAEDETAVPQASIADGLANLSRSIVAHRQRQLLECDQDAAKDVDDSSKSANREHDGMDYEETAVSKKRKRASASEVSLLESIFAIVPLPNSVLKRKIADELGMTPRRVTIWFQNKRARLKKAEGKEKPKKGPFTFHHLALAGDGKLTMSRDGGSGDRRRRVRRRTTAAAGQRVNPRQTQQG